ncbi:hypothetical protein GGR55DRAFT_619134 [Xylaria sp. FL0064]|nr:hypothetical protein GGR55DRAFT_619134 [Xylaria sp. FL0064]
MVPTCKSATRRHWVVVLRFRAAQWMVLRTAAFRNSAAHTCTPVPGALRFRASFSEFLPNHSYTVPGQFCGYQSFVCYSSRLGGKTIPSPGHL